MADRLEPSRTIRLTVYGEFAEPKHVKHLLHLTILTCKLLKLSLHLTILTCMQRMRTASCI